MVHWLNEAVEAGDGGAPRLCTVDPLKVEIDPLAQFSQPLSQTIHHVEREVRSNHLGVVTPVVVVVLK